MEAERDLWKRITPDNPRGQSCKLWRPPTTAVSEAASGHSCTPDNHQKNNCAIASPAALLRLQYTTNQCTNIFLAQGMQIIIIIIIIIKARRRVPSYLSLALSRIFKKPLCYPLGDFTGSHFLKVVRASKTTSNYSLGPCVATHSLFKHVLGQ